MKKSFLTYYVRIAVFVALFLGAIQPNYAHVLEGVEFANTQISKIAKAERIAKNDLLTELIQSSGKKTDLLADIGRSDELFDALDQNPFLVDAWEVLADAGYNNLKRIPVSLEHLSNVLTNPKLSQSGLSQDIVQSIIKGNRNAGAGASALDELTIGLNQLINSNTKFQDIHKLIAELNKGGNFAKGAGWILKDLTKSQDFLGKTIKFEHPIINARPTNANSFIDVLCVKCLQPDDVDILIEYKSGPGSISSSKIKEQFIERDLFNVSSLDEIQWRMEGTEFTPAKLKTWLKENKSTITDIINGNDAAKSSKFKEFFDMNDFDDVITNSHIDDFVDSNYDLIFR